MIRTLRNPIGRRSAPGSRRRPAARLHFDALEGRQLLSLSGPYQTNQGGYGARDNAANASAANGAMVAAWIDSSAGFNEIRAQLFTPSKTWNGGEIVVDEPGLQATDLPPRVASSPDGSRIAVTWGQYLIEQFEVPWEDNGTQAFPDVAMTPADNALISYVATHADGSQSVQIDTLDSNGIYRGTQIIQYIGGPAQ